MTPDELQHTARHHRDQQRRKAHHLHVCMAAGCLSQHSDKIKENLEKQVKSKGLSEKCEVKCVGCMGLCSAGPLVSEHDADGQSVVMYANVTGDDAEAIVGGVGGKPVERLVCDTHQPFFARQQKIVLENSGLIDPESLEDYLAVGGYTALAKALTEMSPSEVLDHVTRSGLRGRGGAGYPTGLKWSVMAKTPGTPKYIICNADEGDPGAFMDRAVLESDPYRVLEGMTLAAFATGASAGYVYVRAEYPLAIARLRQAIRMATRAGLLGNNICGTTLNFSIDIRLGAGAFVCGEETALIASIEGNRGQPRPRPPFPAERGLWGSPTCINNVETLANIAPIIRNGGDWFASIGTEKSKGTKVFALAGKIKNTGLIEVPMGITLGEIVFDIGGGIPDGRTFKAVQTGGPSGGCLPERHLKLQVDYDNLRNAGSIMGSGGMIVIDDTANMVDVARFFMEFCMTESCGKCAPCRVGTWQMHELLDRIVKSEATHEDLALLEELCEMVACTSLCGLGQTAPNPVLSTLRYFRDEYVALIGERRLPVGAGKTEVSS